ncbi:hypothetical protein VP01_2792g2 [Puccinia sorghi]|uniref:Uncharacterized protein n=1 Tax=Puccinia sorghi TaxID=27349 RepID=A0A0L6V2L9_9BASI|nr:hypothetical protein VP01_2792g2 [Puccinia sorghi]
MGQTPRDAKAATMEQALKKMGRSLKSCRVIKSIKDIVKMSWQKRRSFIALLQADCMKDNWTRQGNSQDFPDQIALIRLITTTPLLDGDSQYHLALVVDMALVCLSEIYKASNLTENHNLSSAAHEAFKLILKERLPLLKSQGENLNGPLDNANIENYETIDHYAKK